MLTPQIQKSDRPAEREQMCVWLREFNDSANMSFMTSLREGAESPFLLVATIEDQMVGGLSGKTLHDWIHLDLMAVSPGHRRQGIGRALVEAAFRLGDGVGCRYCYVDTMSYQSPDFYRHLGFDEVGRLPNWDSHGHDKVLLMRGIESM